MSPMLAKGFPFSCPRCRYVAMERTSLIRHFATRHGVVEFFLKVKKTSFSTTPLYPIISAGPKNMLKKIMIKLSR